MHYTPTQLQAFQQKVWRKGRQHGRHMPWRIPEANGQFEPYKIVVSEIMLQQTQVKRVIPKYHEFLEQFPSVEALAKARLGEVLRVWSGLGYNRRAKFLHQAAQDITNTYAGKVPSTIENLIKLPGIGKNTAGAIMAYAYNQPAIFVETNIRSVYICDFFANRDQVSDAEICDIVAKTIDTEQPRAWYWALMDWGAYLKSRGHHARASTQYVKQTTFQGSRRQVRGQVLRLLTGCPLSEVQLGREIRDARLPQVIADLIAEGFIIRRRSKLTLA